MAAVDEPPAYQALLELEKGVPGSPIEQLSEAARIVGIDLKSRRQSTTTECDNLSITAAFSAPKEEWVLRWLLKKLKGASAGQRNVYTDNEQSWILLRILFGRIPIRSLAFMLKENNLLAILQEALQSITSMKNAEEHSLDMDYSPKAGSHLKRTAESEPSTRNRKRKRTDMPTDRPSSGVGVVLAILESIHGLMKHTEQIPAARVSLKAQVKLVLRGDSKTGAIILGESCRLAQVAIAEGQATEVVRRRFYSSLISVLDIWTLRSPLSVQEHGSSTPNDLFVSHALIGVLGLVKVLNVPQHKPLEAQELIDGLERFVALHVVLPLRETFFSTEPKTSTSESSLTKTQLLSKDIQSRLGPVFTDTSYFVLPTLFDIAIRSMPRTNFRRQIQEAPWLESLARSLLAMADHSLGSDVAETSTTKDVSLLRNFLAVAIQRNLKFSLETLVQITRGYSGLLHESGDNIEWHLVAQIIQLDVDVFLPNSGLERSASLLQSLVNDITDCNLPPSSNSSDLYYLIKHEVLIPLVRGFFNARDLPAFTRIWIQQLTRLESERRDDDRRHMTSIWEDDDLARAYGELLATDHAQLNELISDILCKLRSTKETPDLLIAYPQVVILDAILLPLSKSGQDPISPSRYEEMFTKLSNFIICTPEEFQIWRVWRLLQNIIHRYPTCAESIDFDIESTLVPTALKEVQEFSHHSSPKCSINAFWSFNFIVSLGHMSDNNNRFSSHIDKAVHAMFHSFKIPPHNEILWDGGVQSLTVPVASSMACLASILTSNQAMTQITSRTRRLLFDNVLNTLEHGVDSPTKSQLANFWDSYISPQASLQPTVVVEDLVEVIYERLKKEAVPSGYLITTLMSIPNRLISRPRQSAILDLLQSAFLNGNVSPELKLNTLLLMTKFLSGPRLSVHITSDQSIIWKISRSITVMAEDNVRLLHAAFKGLLETVIDKFEAAPEKSSREFVENTYSKVTTEPPSLSYDSLEYPLFIVFLSHLHKREIQLGSRDKFEAICNLRKTTYDALISDLHGLATKMKKEPNQLDKLLLTTHLCFLESFQDLQQANKNSRKEIRKLQEYASKYDSAVQFQRHAKLVSVISKTSGSDIESRVLDCASLFPLDQLYGKDQRSFIHKINLQLSSMKENALVNLIHSICAGDMTGEQSAYQHLLLGIAVLNLGPIQDRESSASTELSSAFTKVSIAFSRICSVEAFSLAAEFLDAMLRSQSKCVTQWNIDNLLSNISVILSPTGPEIDTKFAGTIHTRLCKILGTLFELYRQKLSGRFHLVLPIMQALLRCLFTRNQKAAGQFGAGLALPPWVGASPTLEVRLGTQYSRLLGALCNPTVSSVQRHREAGHASQGLKDQTKKAKSLAGQYLQYLVIEYSSCQLRGHVSPEMKASLMPGMYVILDVMSQSTMRAMNAGMDSSSRAVFKALYDDYMRFGKWDNN